MSVTLSNTSIVRDVIVKQLFDLYLTKLLYQVRSHKLNASNNRNIASRNNALIRCHTTKYFHVFLFDIFVENPK